jgi:hypothetical protein
MGVDRPDRQLREAILDLVDAWEERPPPPPPPERASRQAVAAAIKRGRQVLKETEPK